MKGLSLLWVTICLFRCPASSHEFEHPGQICILGSLELSAGLAILILFGINWEHQAQWPLSDLKFDPSHTTEETFLDLADRQRLPLLLVYVYAEVLIDAV